MEDCGCHDGHHHRRHRRSAPVLSVTVDCTPVTFRTPGQAVNVLSCLVTKPCFCIKDGCPIPVPSICTCKEPPTLVPIPVITRPCGCTP